MNLSAIFSKTGKGVQEASGKTSHLSRADRAVLSAIDGKTPLSEVQGKFEKLAGPKFEALITQLDKDGFIREVSSGTQSAAPARPAAPAAKAPPKAAPPPPADDGDGLDFTQAIKFPPKAPAPAAPKPPPVDLAAAARAEQERKAREQAALDFRSRQEAEAKAKAEAEAKAKQAALAAAEAKARAAAAAAAASAAEAKAKAEAEAKARADAEAKVKAARDAAVRMAAEAKAKAEADAKAKTEAAEREKQAAEERARKEAEDKARLEAELNAKLDSERKAREEAEKRAAEAAEKARKELEEKARRDEEIMRQRLEEEMRAKLEAERKAREEEDRKRREEEDRRRKEEDERRAREDAERRAKEEAERKQREEEERQRREAEEKRRKEEEERRAREEAERKAREEADRKRREDEDRRRKEEDERRAKEEAERKAREEADRKRREDDDRRRKEEDERRAKEEAERKALEDTNRRLEAEKIAREAAERKAKDEAERQAREKAAKEEAERKAKADADAKAAAAAATAAASTPAAAPAGDLGDLLGDLDSFGKREEEEQKAKEEAERKAKEEKARREKEEAERRKREEEERKKREAEEKRRKEEEERRAKEEEERLAREEEERLKKEEEDRKRKAREAAAAAKKAEQRAARPAGAAKSGKADGDDDIDVSDTEMDLEDLKRDQKIAAERAKKAAKEEPPVVVATGRPRKWGKPAAIALFVLLLVGVGVLHVMPLGTAEYEKAASEAMGAPVRIGSARLSVITGIEVRFDAVSIGDAVKIRTVRGAPDVGSLFGPRKSFSRLTLEGVGVSQAQLGDALTGKVGGENFRVARITANALTIDGPIKLPALDLDATVAGDGTLQTVRLTGKDKLVITLQPKGGEVAFEISAGSLTVPFVPALSLSEFGMKGTANRNGVINSEFDGRAYDGVISGTSRIRWGDSWNADGEVRVRGLKVAVFAPALVSEGKVEGRGAYSMAGARPELLHESARIQGEYKIEKGVLGSFDLQRALQTGGAQAAGRTVFNELTGQGLYDKGAAQFSNIAIAAGGMNAGASLNVDANGNLAGRIVADVKTSAQTVRATLNISGKVQDPVIRK